VYYRFCRSCSARRHWSIAGVRSRSRRALAVSFVAIGLFAAIIGYSIGLDAELFRSVAAALMIAIGVVLLVPRFQERLALAGAPLAAWSDRHFGAARQDGVGGQIAVGLLLGAVWSPCVGPTLGAASILVAQGRDLGEVAVTMLAFGFGAALPLAALALVTRSLVALAQAPQFWRCARKDAVRDHPHRDRDHAAHWLRQAN
jgi:cytochrome c biogenesis protein CcdA